MKVKVANPAGARMCRRVPVHRRRSGECSFCLIPSRFPSPVQTLTSCSTPRRTTSTAKRAATKRRLVVLSWLEAGGRRGDFCQSAELLVFAAGWRATTSPRRGGAAPVSCRPSSSLAPSRSVFCRCMQLKRPGGRARLRGGRVSAACCPWDWERLVRVVRFVVLARPEAQRWRVSSGRHTEAAHSTTSRAAHSTPGDQHSSTRGNTSAEPSSVLHFLCTITYCRRRAAPR